MGTHSARWENDRFLSLASRKRLAISTLGVTDFGETIDLIVHHCSKIYKNTVTRSRHAEKQKVINAKPICSRHTRSTVKLLIWSHPSLPFRQTPGKLLEVIFVQLRFHRLEQIDDDIHVTKIHSHMQRKPTIAIHHQHIASTTFNKQLQQIETIVQTTQMYQRLTIVFQLVEIDVDARGLEKKDLDVVEITIVQDGVEETMG